MELTPPNIAKITRPTALHLLNRPRLFAALDRVRHRAATWVTAPPGFGKTSLASSYVAYHGLDCVWYRADAEDADVGNFFCYLTQAGEALRRHDGNLPTFTPEDLPSVAALRWVFLPFTAQQTQLFCSLKLPIRVLASRPSSNPGYSSALRKPILQRRGSMVAADWDWRSAANWLH